MHTHDILYIKPGDIVLDVKTARERVVVDVRQDMGLICFEGSELTGWESAQGYIPTGRTK